jgi:hypothetical protein
MSVSLSSRLRFMIERHGWPAVIGFAMVSASLPVFWFADAMSQEAGQLQEKLRAQRARAQSQPLPVGPTDASLALDEFRQVLPDTETSLKTVGLLHSSAATHNVQLVSGEYRLVRDGDEGLQRYQITLPASGTYPAIRAWLADGVNAYPTLAIDEVTFARKSAESPLVEARVRWSFYFARPQ